MSKRHIARMKVSLELLTQMLGLPADTVIHAVHDDSDEYGIARGVNLFIEHPALDPVGEGSAVPTIAPLYRDVAGHAPQMQSWYGFLEEKDYYSIIHTKEDGEK